MKRPDINRINETIPEYNLDLHEQQLVQLIEYIKWLEIELYTYMDKYHKEAK